MAFFGMVERYAEPAAENCERSASTRIMCGQDEQLQDHYLFHQIRPADVVFIKEYTPQTGLYVVAAGVVLPGCLIEERAGSFLPVQWLWIGRQHTIDPDDTCPFREAPIYEEFDLAVQREIMDLLPKSRHDPFAMVMAAATGAGQEMAEMHALGSSLHTDLQNGALPYFATPNT